MGRNERTNTKISYSFYHFKIKKMKHSLKKLLLLLLFFSIYSFTFAQDIDNCLSINVETPESCQRAEPCVNRLCDYVLGFSMNEGKQEVHEARTLILKWMNITQNYGFTINSKMMKLFKDDDNLLLFGIYMVSMAKGAFTSREKQDYEGLKLMVTYIENRNNEVVQTKAVKEFLKNWKKGKIDQYIDRGTK